VVLRSDPEVERYGTEATGSTNPHNTTVFVW